MHTCYFKALIEDKITKYKKDSFVLAKKYPLLRTTQKPDYFLLTPYLTFWVGFHLSEGSSPLCGSSTGGWRIEMHTSPFYKTQTTFSTQKYDIKKGLKFLFLQNLFSYH